MKESQLQPEDNLTSRSTMEYTCANNWSDLSAEGKARVKTHQTQPGLAPEEPTSARQEPCHYAYRD